MEPKGFLMENEIVLIETKIKEGDASLAAADKHAAKAVEYKVAAGLLYIEAREMCNTAGLNWKETCKEVTSRSYSQVAKVIQIAKADDPHAEAERQRERNNEQVRAHREEKVSYVRDIDYTTGVDTNVIEPGPDKTAAILTRVNQLTKTELKEFLYALADQVKPLGISMSFTIM
jgi:hypothetical protein